MHLLSFLLVLPIAAQSAPDPVISPKVARPPVKVVHLLKPTLLTGCDMPSLGETQLPVVLVLNNYSKALETGPQASLACRNN